jgi:lipoprotein NlpD
MGIGCLLLGGCADTSAEGPENYIVRPQDTLYSIAWRHDLDYRDLARWNNLGPDFRISVGQVLVLGPGRTPPAAPAPPPETARPSTTGPPSVSTPPPGSAIPRVSKPRPLPEPQNSAPKTSTPPSLAPAPTAPAAAVRAGAAAGSGTAAGGAAHGATPTWVWPTDRIGAPRPVPGGGVLLSGRLGQDVRAATAGRVVYAGSGMRGYGNLIIIKHADNLLSAYAHNREMLVHDGQEVATGQLIAHMGEGGPQSPVLYFEIRQNGRPVDPLPYLPRAK